jgi:hypothetical protein
MLVDCKNKAFNDNAYESQMLGEPASLVSCDAARHLGENLLAAEYARYALYHKKNPVKRCMAHRKLAALSMIHDADAGAGTPNE